MAGVDQDSSAETLQASPTARPLKGPWRPRGHDLPSDQTLRRAPCLSGLAENPVFRYLSARRGAFRHLLLPDELLKGLALAAFSARGVVLGYWGIRATGRARLQARWASLLMLVLALGLAWFAPTTEATLWPLPAGFMSGWAAVLLGRDLWFPFDHLIALQFQLAHLRLRRQSRDFVALRIGLLAISFLWITLAVAAAFLALFGALLLYGQLLSWPRPILAVCLAVGGVGLLAGAAYGGCGRLFRRPLLSRMEANVRKLMDLTLEGPAG